MATVASEDIVIEEEVITIQVGYSTRQLLGLFGAHHFLILSILIEIVMLSLVLGGCNSNSSIFPDLYIVSYRYSGGPGGATQNTTATQNITTAIALAAANASLEARVGYFGLCLRGSQFAWQCSSDGALQYGLDKATTDPLDILSIANRFRVDIVFPAIMILGITFAFLGMSLLFTFPGWQEDEDGIARKPFPSRPVTQVCLLLMATSSAFILISTIWQHTAAVAATITAETMSHGTLKGSVGPAATGLVWAGFAVSVIPVLGLIFMLISLSLPVMESDMDD